METIGPYTVAVVAFGNEATQRWTGHWTLMRSDAESEKLGEGQADGDFDTEREALAAAKLAGTKHAGALGGEGRPGD